jgi:hypothetical protein
MNPGIVAVIALCALMVLWYGAGYLSNRRRGQRLFRWLEKGLDVLGGENESGWIGPASGARFNVLGAAPPFQRLQIVFLLQNREVPLKWLWDHYRGKRDWLIVRATLGSPRQGEIEIGPDGQTERHREPSWAWTEGPHGLAIAHKGPGVQHQLTGLEPWLENYGHHLHAFLWHKTDPHIQLQMEADGLTVVSSEVFLSDLQTAVANRA